MWDTLPNELVTLIMQHYLTGLRDARERLFNYPWLFDRGLAPGQDYAEYERGLHAEWEHARYE